MNTKCNEQRILSLLFIMFLFFIMSSCETKEGVKINNIGQTDSVSVRVCNSKQNAKVIKDCAAINKIIDLLENHTHRELCEFWIRKRVTFYINGQKEDIGVLGNHIKYNGEYVCDDNLEMILNEYTCDIN